MNSDLTESVQASIRPGEMKDVYYYGETNLTKQAYPTVVNERFVQLFTNPGAGSSQFIISPQGGVSDIVCQFTTPASAGANYTTLALDQGWGYSLINRLSVRYGSSAQYFWSGAQMFLQNLMDCENATKADAVSKLGGNQLTGSSCGSALAYVYLKLPHNSIRAMGKPLPFPSDLLVQPIVVTVELFALNAILINQSATANLNLTNGPPALFAAQLQVKQEMLTDSSDLLARRVDMNSHAYTFPLMYFAQQETQVQIPSSSQAQQNVNLTGFRAGEVKSIVLWLTPNDNGQNTAGSGNYHPLAWSLPNNVQITYNGEIFSRFDTGSSQLWNLTQAEKTSSYNNIIALTGAGGGTQAAVSYWIDAQFSQVGLAYDRQTDLIHGKPVLNAVVQVQFDTPALNTSYILHAMYIYNASLLCSRGSSEYIF